MHSENTGTPKAPLVSLVAPMYNEEEVVGKFFAAVDGVLSGSGIDYEIICVNDGSIDGTIDELKKYSQNDKRIKVLDLSRNYGKEIALTAGLDYATGQAIIPIDCDLQDPPELIPRMIDRWREGCHIVLARRVSRNEDSGLKRLSSKFFYSLLSRISDFDVPENVGDFRLLDREVLEALKTFPERSRFMKGLFASVGYRQAVVEYDRPARIAGNSKWSYLKLYRLALDGIFSFSTVPLKIWSYIGVAVALYAFVYGVYLIIKTLIFGVGTPGYASLMVVLLFASGSILICLGVIGEYLSRIFIEVKQRPLYLVMDKIGFDD